MDPNPFFGRVAYAYGHVIDQPLSIIRMGYESYRDSVNANIGHWTLPPFAVFPFWNSQGQPDVGHYTNGKQMYCVPTRRCAWITWTGMWFDLVRSNVTRSAWHGTLLEDKEDAVNTFYRRNRVYDANTGQFTQEDPIGLAGGLNSYGYANGDPVSYSDPYGLCPLCIGVGAALLVIADAVGTAADVHDVATTGARWSRGEATNGEMAFSLGGAAVGVFLPGAGYGPLARGAEGLVNPQTIRFTQNSIGEGFKDGSGSVRGLADGLRAGSVDPGAIPPLRLVEHNGAVYTLDNRRLAAFHLAGVNAPARMATPAEISREWSKKFTTLNGGTSITIRGGGGSVP
jgi:RHS repeat-associated protein